MEKEEGQPGNHSTDPPGARDIGLALGIPNSDQHGLPLKAGGMIPNQNGRNYQSP